MQVKRFYARIEKLLPSLIVIFFCHGTIVGYVEAPINERAVICRFDVFYDCSSRSTKAYQENFTSHLLKPNSLICDEFLCSNGYSQSVLAISGIFFLKPYANSVTYVKRDWFLFLWPKEKSVFVSISSKHKTFSKNMAQGPRPAKAHPRSAERVRTSQMSCLQKRDGPLRFFLADCLLNVLGKSASNRV